MEENKCVVDDARKGAYVSNVILASVFYKNACNYFQCERLHFEIPMYLLNDIINKKIERDKLEKYGDKDILPLALTMDPVLTASVIMDEVYNGNLKVYTISNHQHTCIHELIHGSKYTKDDYRKLMLNLPYYGDSRKFIEKYKEFINYNQMEQLKEFVLDI